MRSRLGYLLVSLALAWASCSGSGTQSQDLEDDKPTEGTVGYVDLNDPLEEVLVAEGQAIYQAKCSKCHELDNGENTGPAWGGITNRRAPEWIMTMILNVNTMVQVDTVAHGLLQEAGVQMPDQRLSVDKARSVLEFMRQNDLDRQGLKDQGRKNLAE